jgi:hypothetical protein
VNILHSISENYQLKAKIFWIIIQCSFSSFSISCTSFGIITNKGVIISKNRDYFYSKQVVEIVKPLKQFDKWYDNDYNYHFSFFSLISKNDVKFGINEAGLSAIEEDPSYPSDAFSQRKYMQPHNGYSEGMILYGILQNFSTVSEIVPYIDSIFSTAAPNFYQVADANNILTVEVAYGDENDAPKRAYKYNIISISGDYFVHSNTYLNPDFQILNLLSSNIDSINGSNNRFNKIIKNIKLAKGDYTSAFDWYLDTKSDIGSLMNKNYCQNTSLFRTYLQHITSVDADTESTTEYGTVSSFMVDYKEAVPMVSLRLLQNINNLDNGDQKVVYKEMQAPLNKLFDNLPLVYSTRSFIRPSPVNGVCFPSSIPEILNG